MKKVNNYFMKDDFEYETETIRGAKFYIYNNHIYSSLDTILYANCEAQICEKCGKPTFSKSYTYCEECNEKGKNSVYKTLPIKEVLECDWFYSDKLDVFFQRDDLSNLYSEFDSMDLDDLQKLTLDDLRIHPCEKIYPRQINVVDLFEDRSDEDYDYETYSNIDKIEALINEANQLLRKEPVSYSPIMKEKYYPFTEKDFEEMKDEYIDDCTHSEEKHRSFSFFI